MSGSRRTITRSLAWTSATDKEITRAYRYLAKKYHPDAHPGSEDRFKEISAAYEVLGDADKRKEYDEVRRLGPLSGMTGRRRRRARLQLPHRRPLRPVRWPFPRAAVAPPRARAARGTGGPQRGSDLEASLHLDFQEAVEGVVTSVNVTSGAVCHTCAGLGTAPGSSPVVCSRCGGIGLLNDNQGLFSLSSPCPDCGGRGTKILDPCPVCGGSGVEPKGRVGEGAHPCRRRRRAAHPCQRTWRGRTQRRPLRRPLRHRPGRPPPPVRQARQGSHAHRADLLLGGRPRRHGDRFRR